MFPCLVLLHTLVCGGSCEIRLRHLWCREGSPLSRELISLLDIMRQIKADAVFSFAYAVGATQGLFEGVQIGDKAPPRHPDDTSEINVTPEWRRVLLKIQKTQAVDICKTFELPASAQLVSQIIGELRSRAECPISRLEQHSRELARRMEAELAARLFLYVDGESARFYAQPFEKWDEVRTAFPSATYDIEEASKALGLRRSTASVFHLMRVLEHGLHSLAKRFAVPFEHKAWGEVIERTEKAIKDIKQQRNKPADWKDEEQFYSEAATQFMHFKNAWRNYTAHLQFKYTEDEAESIYRHVRDFMKHIAKRLKE